ncbi:MAG: hypothetical protein ACK2UW_09195 [Anaerolineales bacterium]
MSTSLKCPNCGANLDFDAGSTPIIRCPYCQSSVIIPAELRTPASGGSSAVRPEAFFQPDQIAKIQAISRLVHEKKKIEAIKLFREVFGTGLKEAKEAIEQLERGEAVSINIPAQGTTNPAEVEAAIRRYLQDGEKIDAIRFYRETFHQGLKDSKDAIDAYEQTGVLRLPGSMQWDGSISGFVDATAQAVQMIAIVELVQAGQETAAIYAYQEAFGVSLGEAHDAIQKIALGVTPDGPSVTIQSNSLAVPVGQAAAVTTGVISGVSCLGLLGVILIALIVIVPLLVGLTSPGGPLEGVWNRINPLAYARVTNSFGEQGIGAGFLEDPRAIGIDPSGSIVIANYDDGRVQKFDASGNYQMMWNIGPDRYVSGMAVDRAGDVYLVYRGDIWKYEGESGQMLDQLGAGTDQWFEAISETAVGGIAAAIDSEQILAFDPQGRPTFSLTEMDTHLSSEPEGVEDLAVDGLGNLYVLTDEEAVIVYSSQGRLLVRFGSSGDEPGQLRAPSAIAVDGQGRIYISDFKGIQVFSNDGRYQDRIEVQGYTFDLAFDPQGDLWAVTNLPRVFEYQISAP